MSTREAALGALELRIEAELVEESNHLRDVVLVGVGGDWGPAVDEVAPPGASGGLRLLGGVLRRAGEVAGEDLGEQSVAGAFLLRHPLRRRPVDEPRPSGARPLLGAGRDEPRFRQDAEVGADRIRVQPDALGQLGGVQRPLGPAQDLENAYAARIAERSVDAGLVDSLGCAHRGIIPTKLVKTLAVGKRRAKGADEALAVLEIKDLHVAIEDGTEIVRGVDLSVDTNEVHAVMGPNGSGKSTLAYALMGHPAYEITDGDILLDGESVLELEADERAQRGLFLAFQYPHAVPGVTVTNFLRSAVNAIRKAKNGGEDNPIAIKEFRQS